MTHAHPVRTDANRPDRPLPVRLRLCLAMMLCSMFLIAACDGGKPDSSGKKAESAPPMSVPVVEVERQHVRDVMLFVCITQAVKTVDVQARVEGFLEKRLYKEGSIVEQGQTLFLIQKDKFRDQLAEAKAQLARDQAALDQARLNYKRFKTLVEKQVVSQEEFDIYNTRLREAEATVRQDTAQVQQAQLNLNYTTVTAPITGRIGQAQENIGALVGRPGSTLLAVMTQVDPIYVNTNISETVNLEYIQKARTMRQADEIYEEESHIPLELILADGSPYPFKGRVHMTAPTVNQQTGTIGVQAVFPNPAGVLRPGEYVTGRIAVESKEPEMVVPQIAVMIVQGQKSVYVAGKNGTVESRPIETGIRTGDLVVVKSGLSPGERVIVEGAQMLRPGMKVAPRPWKGPPANATGGGEG